MNFAITRGFVLLVVVLFCLLACLNFCDVQLPQLGGIVSFLDSIYEALAKDPRIVSGLS